MQVLEFKIYAIFIAIENFCLTNITNDVDKLLSILSGLLQN